MNFPCTPADLREVGDEGHLGLLTVLVEKGWRVYGRRDGLRVTLTAEGDSYVMSCGGSSDKEAALQLFSELFSDEPDAIAEAAAFWPPPRPVTWLADWRR